MTGRFVPRSPDDVARLVRDYPLATLVSNGPAGFMATPLPLVAEQDGDGCIVALIGHFARRNPHLAALGEAPDAVAIFQGPHAYIPPRLVSKPGWGPTWNYAVARFQVEVVPTPERTEEAIARLAQALEGDRPEAWRPEHMGARHGELAKHIIAFRAEVRAVEATFKLGQDEDARSFAEIVEGVGDPALAAMMQAQRGA